MPYSPLGFFTGFAIARFNDLKGSQAAQVAVIPGILGPSIPSLLITQVFAVQQAKSLRPVIAVEPPEHNYGDDVPLRTPVSQTFVVSNTGTADLEITETRLDSTTDFVIDSGGVISGTPLKLPPGATHNITVIFTPTIEGEQFATLLIFSNDPDEPIFKIPLEGEGVEVAPTIEVDLTLDYETVTVGSSRSRPLVVKNRGTAVLEVSATSLSDLVQFAIVSGAAPFTVAPGEFHFLEASFTPTPPGSDVLRTADLVIGSNDQDQPIVNIRLEGIGSTPTQLKKP